MGDGKNNDVVELGNVGQGTASQPNYDVLDLYRQFKDYSNTQRTDPAQELARLALEGPGIYSEPHDYAGKIDPNNPLPDVSIEDLRRGGNVEQPQERPTIPEADRNQFEFNGVNGRARMATLPDGTYEYNDAQGRMTSFDGRTWIRDNGDVAFQGTIRMEDGNIVRENNRGVRDLERPDGSTVRSIVTRSGERVTMETSAIPDGGTASDRTIRITDNRGTFVSQDNGQNWAQRDENEVFTGGVHGGGMGIDEYGNFWHSWSSNPSERIVTERTFEAERFQSRVNEIQQRHNVRIAPADLSYTSAGRDGAALMTRQPTYLELDALDRALSRNPRDTDDGLNIAFLRDTPDSRRTGAWGRYVSPGNLVEIYDLHNYGRGRNGIEGVIEHELAHHEQSEAARRGGRDRASLDLLYQNMGWDNGRIRDLDNNLWTYDFENRNWTATIDGEPATISSSEMRERARVRPPSNYFTSSWEMHAEAVMAFRTDRQNLMNDNPQLYSMIRDWDQDQLDRRYGSNADGTPRMIRDIDGTVISNTQENRRRIRNEENSWRVNRLVA